MAKRHASELSDGSDDESRAKRPRVDPEEDRHEIPSPIKNAKGKSKADGKVMQDGGADEAELDALLAANLSGIPGENDTDTEDERKDEASMQDAKRKKEAQIRGIAEKGIIESIEMHQFMCHRHLAFKFGPQVNFIIGHNGSGKSAVLSGVMVALGAKATSTGRGNGLKSFIREGQSMAEVTISIRNQGDGSFKPEVYGKSIFVTRRFTKEGSSSYKIKSASGKLISTRRDELSAICDHMNIQVDNPMNIMSQDSARQFLSNSHPKDKYQFFMKGTQLTQLREEYETCHENIQKTTRTLQLKREETPYLEKAFDEANTRNNEANKAREKATQLRVYEQEIAWAYVKEKEDDMTAKIEETEKARRRLPKLVEAVAKAEADVDRAGEVVARLNAELQAIPCIDTIVKERDEINARIKSNRDEIRDCKSNETQMDERTKVLNNEINDLQQKILNEMAKRRGNPDEEREEAFRNLQAAKDERDAKVLELRSYPNKIDTLRNHIQQEESQERDADIAISKFRKSIEAAVSNIEQCQRQSGNDLALFGKNLRTILSLVEKEIWVGEIPVGPFGIYVSLKDPKWTPVMRIQLGRSMSSFAVTDNRDRHKLKNIFDRHGNYDANIVVSDVDLFDYSRGEPPEHFMTVLRSLDIKHEFIKRILINQSHIEKVLLADSRKDGDNLLLQLGGAGYAWSADLYIARRYPDGGATSIPLRNSFNSYDPQQHMFAGTDRTADIERLVNERKEAEQCLQDATSARAMILQRCRDKHTELRELETQEKVLRKRVNDLESQIVRLEDKAVVGAPDGIDLLGQRKDAAKEEKRFIEKQFTHVVKRNIDLDADNRILLDQRRILDHQISEWQTQNTAMKDKIETAMQERIEKSEKKKYWDNKLAKEKDNVVDLEAAVEGLQTEFTIWSEKAELVGPLIENPRKHEVIKKQIQSIKGALHEHERQQGATPEEIAIERDNAKYALENHKNQIQEISNLNKSLKSSLYKRVGKWNTFLTYMVRTCKDQFQYYLWTRGYYGKLFFDHQAETLNLKVQTEDQASSQSQNKDPKALSGGEKSFTTICLLLALWQMIQCPIRCLDEFDVFMDPINRKISMKLMVETANNSGKQYILITPQDMSHIPLGPTVSVRRMTDPEDSQTALNF